MKTFRCCILCHSIFIHTSFICIVFASRSSMPSTPLLGEVPGITLLQVRCARPCNTDKTRRFNVGTRLEVTTYFFASPARRMALVFFPHQWHALGALPVNRPGRLLSSIGHGGGKQTESFIWQGWVMLAVGLGTLLVAVQLPARVHIVELCSGW